jgi:hypothetical protein
MHKLVKPAKPRREPRVHMNGNDTAEPIEGGSLTVLNGGADLLLARLWVIHKEPRSDIFQIRRRSSSRA